MEYALTEKKRQPGRKTRQNVSQDTGMPVYALKNPRQKYAWQEIPKKKHGTENRTTGQFRNCTGCYSDDAETGVQRS